MITSIIVLLMFAFALFFNLKFKPSPAIPEGKNIAIVFGAAVWSIDKPSPMFKARIDRSHELFKNESVHAIQVTGGNAPGELSEAQTALNRLIELGVELYGK